MAPLLSWYEEAVGPSYVMHPDQWCEGLLRRAVCALRLDHLLAGLLSRASYVLHPDQWCVALRRVVCVLRLDHPYELVPSTEANVEPSSYLKARDVLAALWNQACAVATVQLLPRYGEAVDPSSALRRVQWCEGPVRRVVYVLHLVQ